MNKNTRTRQNGTPYSRMVGRSGPFFVYRVLGILGLLGCFYGLFSFGLLFMGVIALLDGPDSASLGTAFLAFGIPGLALLVPAAALAFFGLSRSIREGIALRESYIRDVATTRS
ncbi:MAG: hypothetical protein EP330_06335 [Deltaproteobacteria bacterium]|nr:MAG: hypothetical protein EP330_06335 [Deltaproteobacteria bacterium]